MTLAAEMLAVLVCPESKGPMLYFSGGENGADPNASFFLCPSSRLRYRIEDGVPVLLVDDAERLEATEVDRLVARAKQLGIAGA